MTFPTNLFYVMLALHWRSYKAGWCRSSVDSRRSRVV